MKESRGCLIALAILFQIVVLVTAGVLWVGFGLADTWMVYPRNFPDWPIRYPWEIPVAMQAIVLAPFLYYYLTRPVRKSKCRLLRVALLLGVAGAFYPVVMEQFVKPQTMRAMWRFDEIVSLTTANRWGETMLVLWVDIRRREDFDKEHIPGALHFDTDDWSGSLATLKQAWSPNCELVLYDDGTSDSDIEPHIMYDSAIRSVANRLKKETGWSNVHILDGGWHTWHWHKTHPT